MNSFYQFIHGNYGYLINGIVIVFCVLVFAFINMYMYGAVRSAYQRARLQLLRPGLQLRCFQRMQSCPSRRSAAASRKNRCPHRRCRRARSRTEPARRLPAPRHGERYDA